MAVVLRSRVQEEGKVREGSSEGHCPFYKIFPKMYPFLCRIIEVDIHTKELEY